MTPSSHQHQAHYDDDGNIIIPSESDAPSVWEVISSDDDQEFTVPEVGETPVSTEERVDIHLLVRKNMKSLVDEGAAQYAHSAQEFKRGLQASQNFAKRTLQGFTSFLLQPVWIPRKGKEPKEYSRLTLFVTDTVRFGATFAAIFAGLFAVMNYQSFYALAQEHLNPVEHALNAHALTETVESALSGGPGSDLSTIQQEGDLLSILPAVGPPDNRIIIPKLGLNVPLEAPPLAPLLNEQWDQLEVEIQKTLEEGVAHYPGTAKPGQAGNFFVTGHSSYYPWAEGAYKTVFARLHELNVGDEYWVYYGGDKHRYIVRGKKEVYPSDVSVLDQPTNKRIGTLMTCTPIGTTLRRLIISSEEVDPHTGISLAVGENSTVDRPQARPAMLPI